MKSSETNQRRFLIITLLMVFIPWTILAIISGLYDLQISNAIVNFHSWWGGFGQDYGEAPGYGIIGIALTVLLGSPIKKIKQQKIPGLVISAIGIGVMIYFIVNFNAKIMTICVHISGSILIFSLLEYKNDLIEYRKFAQLVLLLAIINPLIFVQTTKLLCGRVRFRDLVELGFEFYTPWYLPPGPSIHHASFPSGHTAMGWMLLPLIALVIEKKAKKPLKIFTICFVSLWGFFIACSRVVIGAHYFSDVLFSTGMAFLAYVILYYFIYLKQEKVVKEEMTFLE